MLAALLTVCGLVLGKTAAVLLPNAYRDRPLAQAPIRCESCGRRATPTDLIPFSEVRSGARCPECGRRDSIKWLLLPAGTAAVSLLHYLKFESEDQAIVAGLFAAILGSLVITDLSRRLLPDRIVLPAIALAVGLSWMLPDSSLVESGIGAAGALGIAAVLVVGSLPFGSGAFGIGDAKLIVMLGVLLGLMGVIVAVFIAIIASGIVAASLLATRILHRRSHMPLGPFLAFGGIVTLLWGSQIWHWLF
jgi:prepilin signal peptidase PulO-like enzyme (type II secretory pathway)